jgi:hypothetical protein
MDVVIITSSPPPGPVPTSVPDRRSRSVWKVRAGPNFITTRSSNSSVRHTVGDGDGQPCWLLRLVGRWDELITILFGRARQPIPDDRSVARRLARRRRRVHRPSAHTAAALPVRSRPRFWIVRMPIDPNGRVRYRIRFMPDWPEEGSRYPEGWWPSHRSGRGRPSRPWRCRGWRGAWKSPKAGLARCLKPLPR